MTGNNTGESYINYLKRQEFIFSYQDRHPEIKVIADAFRQKRGRKGLKQLSAELGCVRPFEVDRFLKGASVKPHQIEAVKNWLVRDEEISTCLYCGAKIVALMATCVNPYCQKEI
jgi:hypothetical protein